MSLSQKTNSWRSAVALAIMTLVGSLLLMGCDREPSPSASNTSSTSVDDSNNPKSTVNARTESLARIQKAIASRHLEDAEELARQHLLGHPDDMEGGVLLATALYQQGRRGDAANALLDFSDGNTAQTVMLHAQAAEWWFESGEYEKALTLLDQTIQKNPDRHAIRHRLAEMLNSRGFRHQANNHLRHLLGRTTLSMRELVALLNPTATWATFEAKPDIGSDEDIARYGALNMAAALRSNGDVREALTLLENVDDAPNRHPAVDAALGWLLTLNQDFASAAEWLQKTEASSQKYPAFWLAVGNLALHHRKPFAKEAFLQALEMEPSCTEAVEGLTQHAGLVGDSNLTSRFRKRRLQLAETQELAKEIAKSAPPNVQLAAEMSKLLTGLGRPAEGLGWQEMAYASFSSQSSQLLALRRHQQNIRKSVPSGIQRDKILAGSELPTIQDWDMRLTSLSDGIHDKNVTPKLGSPVPDAKGSHTDPVFVDVATERGLEFQYRNASTVVQKEFRLFEALGSGVACLDYDLDGSVDLYLGQAGGEPPKDGSAVSDKLFRQQENRFVDRTSMSDVTEGSYTLGVSSGDWNQDGWPDLLIGNLGQNALLINQGDGTFQAIPGDEAWQAERFTSSIALADINGDHLPEIVEINYVDDPRVFNPIEYHPDGTPVLLPGPKHFAPGSDWMFHSSDAGTPVGKLLGESEKHASTGLGLVITNLDDDRSNEVFVANDQNANHHWDLSTDTRTSPTWRETAVLRGCAFGPGGRPMACMGVAPADFDQNGKVDLHITNFNEECSNLYLQRRDGLFVDQAIQFGMDKSTVEMVGFGTQPIDFDNDRWIDLVIGNGHIEDFTARGKPFKMPTQILRRSTDQFVATEVRGDDRYWQSDHLARAVALCDWNRDGLVDTAISDLIEPFALLENRTATKNTTLQLELIGTQSERDAIGCEILVRCNEFSSRMVVTTGDGYLCKNESVLFIGLGQANEIDTLSITWPSGIEQTFYDLPVNQRILVIESASASEQPWIRSKFRPK